MPEPNRVQPLSAREVVELLNLKPHPEGGYYSEVFRSGRRVASAHHAAERAACTSIYFLLQSAEFSALHRVSSDELWHHYAGDPLELVLLEASGAERVRLGPDLARGERPLAVARAGVFQAARPIAGPHGYALCGCSVAPGFEFSDFEMPKRDELARLFPEQRELIAQFTRD